MPKSVTQYGREHMSITALDSACRMMSQVKRACMDSAAYLIKRSKTSSIPSDAFNFSQSLLESSSQGYRAIL